MTLMLAPGMAMQAAVVAEVAQLMEAAGMQELLCLTKARIPVVKFEYRHPVGAIKVCTVQTCVARDHTNSAPATEWHMCIQQDRLSHASVQ